MHTVHNAQRKMQPNVASLASHWVGSHRDETSRAELRHPQLNLIKSTLGVRLRVELGLFFYEWNSKGTWGWGAKMRPRRNVMKSWMNTAQAQVPKGHEPWREAKRDVGSKCKLMARAKMRCSSLDQWDKRTDDRLSISHAHRNRISMIIIMSRKTGKPVMPNSLECQQMNCQMLRHRFVHSMKTFPNLSRHEWLRFSYTIERGERGNQQASTLFMWRMVSYFKDCQRLSLFPIQSVLIFSSR